MGLEPSLQWSDQLRRPEAECATSLCTYSSANEQRTEGPQLPCLKQVPKQSTKSSGNGSQAGETSTAAGDKLQKDQPDLMKGLHPEDRKTGAISAESALEDYHDVVDEYFKTITRK